MDWIAMEIVWLRVVIGAIAMEEIEVRPMNAVVVLETGVEMDWVRIENRLVRMEVVGSRVIKIAVR